MAKVALHGERGEVIGNVAIEKFGRDFDAKFESESDSVSLRWHPAEQFVELSDSTGAHYRVEFDSFLKNPELHSAALQAFQSHGDALKLTIETIQELDSRGLLQGRPDPERVKSMNSYAPGTYYPSDPFYGSTYYYPTYDDSWMYSGGGGPTGPGCNGPEVRGTAYGEFTRSIICEMAHRDMNLKCWNSWCTGCCRELSCDAVCFLDDYLCAVAGQTGWSCSKY